MTANAITPVVLANAPTQNFASGYYTGDGGTGSFYPAIGFTPRRVKIVNVTDAIIFEWFEGLPATNFIKTAANGTTTIETTSAIVVNGASVTATEVIYQAEPAGTGAPGDGTMGTTTITELSPNKALPQLAFNAIANISAKAYYFFAQG